MAAAGLLGAGLGVGSWYSSNQTTASAKPGVALVPAGETKQQAATSQSSTPLVQGSADEPAAAVAEALGPAVVQIEVGQGLGSGIVYDAQGLILTNAHVVQGQTEVTVRRDDGTTLQGQVLGADTQADVAVVRVDASAGLPVARLATDKPKVGQTAIGIGSPFGLQETVTAGIVSAVDRPVEGESGAAVNMIQTDAAINPGNSGGALANKRGEVIGINSAIYSQKGENNGIGFAIPIQTAKKIADKIVGGESLDHAFLGVSSKAPADGQGGAQVANVSSGGPAAAAGIKTGDVVVEIDGQAVKDPSDLSAQIVSHSPGDTVTLTIDRNGQTSQVEVTLGKRPATASSQGSGNGQGSPGSGNGGGQVPGSGNGLGSGNGQSSPSQPRQGVPR